MAEMNTVHYGSTESIGELFPGAKCIVYVNERIF